MPLTLAVAGLTSVEKSALVSAIKAKSTSLTHAWTLFWEPSDFPASPDGLLYCPKRDEGRRWAERFAHESSLLIAALPPLESTPSEVPLFVRMPFRPQDIVEALNIAAKRILAHSPEESEAAPLTTREEKVEIQVLPRGASRVSPIVLMLFAVFHGAEKSRFYKIRQTQTIGTTPVEIWCWPDFDLYWCSTPDAQLLAQDQALYEIYNCQGKRESLSAKAQEVRHAGPLLWRAGTRAFKTAEILPWFPADQKMTLSRWPDLPIEARTLPLIRIFCRLTRADATFTELLSELKIGRKDLSAVVNGLIMSGDLSRSKEPRATAFSPANIYIDPEQALFLRALSLRCAESFDKAIENTLARP